MDPEDTAPLVRAPASNGNRYDIGSRNQGATDALPSYQNGGIAPTNVQTRSPWFRKGVWICFAVVVAVAVITLLVHKPQAPTLLIQSDDESYRRHVHHPYAVIVEKLYHLNKQLEGNIYMRNQSGFHSAAAVWNLQATQHPPLAVIQVKNELDVQRALPVLTQLYRSNGIPFRIRSGGHHKIGYSTVEDGIVLSLARMNTIRLDIETTASDSAVVSPPTTIATFGPAALTKEVIFQALVAHGYAGVVGACGDVAESGFILGGGFGFQSRHRGLGLDNVVGMRVVLANGAVQEIGGDDDLFWAMRGAGGGNFGVVTQLRYQLHKTLDTQVVAHVDVLFQDLPYVMHRIGELSRDAHLLPSEICVMMDERHGTDGIGINFLWFSLDDKREVQVVVVELKNVLDSILTKATPAVQYNVTTQRFSWSSYFNFWKADSRMSSWDNPYAQAWCGYLFQDNNTIAVWADISNQLSKILEECPHLYPDVELYGGAISQVPWNATAFPYRKAVYNVGVLLIVPENNDTHNGLELYHEQVAKVNAWWPSVSQYLTGTYVNYPMASLKKNEYARRYWGDNLERLVHIKQKYDPWNDFAFEQSLPMQL